MSRISQASGVARSTISRMIETGDGMLYSWKKVAEAIGIRVSDLMEDSNGL